MDYKEGIAQRHYCCRPPRTHLTDFFPVAKHNAADSCWVVLYGKVYDVISLAHYLVREDGTNYECR